MGSKLKRNYVWGGFQEFGFKVALTLTFLGTLHDILHQKLGFSCPFFDVFIEYMKCTKPIFVRRFYTPNNPVQIAPPWRLLRV